MALDLYRLISKDMCKTRMKREASTSSLFMVLHSFIANNGFPVEFIARISSNKLMYTVLVTYQFNDASFYDGDNFDEAFKYYVETVSALLSVPAAEEVKRMKSSFLNKSKYLLSEMSEYRIQNRTTAVQKKKLYWGLSEEF